MLEETGYAGDPPVLLGIAWSNPSLMTSKIATIWIANARKVADLALDHGEEVTVELFPSTDALALIRDGRVDHALAVMSLYAWLLRDHQA